MKGHDPEYIKNRIEWQAGRHSLPYPNTNYWSEAPCELAALTPNDIVLPTIYSASSSDGFTVVGVDEILTVNQGKENRFFIDEISAIEAPPDQRTKAAKPRLDALMVRTGKRNRYRLPCEMGSPCFAIWGVLLMLSRMQRKG